MFERPPPAGIHFRARLRAAARRFAFVLLAAVLLAGHPAAAPVAAGLVAAGPGPDRLAGAGVASAVPAAAAFVVPAEGARLLPAGERGQPPSHGPGPGGAEAVLAPLRTAAAAPTARCRRRPVPRRAAARAARAFAPRAPPLRV